MPKKDSLTTKDALLAAAREEFAEHGVAGARVDRIAQRAGVNKERIYGYFGNKDKLFDAVIQVALDEFAAITPQPGEDPVEYVGHLFDYYQEHPDLLRLLTWEGLHVRPGALPEQEWRVERCRKAVASLAARMDREPSPEVGRTLLTLKGMAMMPMVMPQLAEILVGGRMDDPESIAAMREHVMAFARTALRDTDGNDVNPSR
ncbi:TetR/AcrR family transcriptional regulator [Spirillospora sp. NPDC048911]|uniref:TetR/AcrR family transcriptional regulator n=1 Tax=Spirillospora sp. NPDC048911 TaxID=3364527 RepID=UPI00371B63B3